MRPVVIRNGRFIDLSRLANGNADVSGILRSVNGAAGVTTVERFGLRMTGVNRIAFEMTIGVDASANRVRPGAPFNRSLDARRAIARALAVP